MLDSFRVNRYSSLIDLWNHQNTVQLQWPPVVIAASLLVVSIVVPNRVDLLANITLWGSNVNIVFGAGVPLLLTGIASLAMLYTMGRAQKIMQDVEKEICLIETCFDKDCKSFSDLNHPRGISGPRMIRRFMAIFLAVPMTYFGMVFTAGLTLGSGIWLLSFLVLVLIEAIAHRLEGKKN